MTALPDAVKARRLIASRRSMRCHARPGFWADSKVAAPITPDTIPMTPGTRDVVMPPLVLISCGMRHMVDNEHVYWSFGRFQFEPELLLQSDQERWSSILSLSAERLG